MAAKNETVFIRVHSWFICLLVFVVAAGCQNTQEADALAAQVEQLTQEKTQLQQQIERSQAENKQLKEQVQVLSGLPEEVKLENLRRLKSVRIGRYTGLYDKDHDGRKETLIVYIQPMDEEGDKIKAAGDVDVQLWDLSKTPATVLRQEDAGAGPLLGRWRVTSEQLKTLWFDTLLTINYRLTFDIPGTIDPDTLPEDSLTVKITFTDYLTGQVFTDQKAIKPAPP